MKMEQFSVCHSALSAAEVCNLLFDDFFSQDLRKNESEYVSPCVVGGPSHSQLTNLNLNLTFTVKT